LEPDYIKLKEIKPVLARYIRESQTLLKKSVVPDEDTIHDVRVLMKKSRAAIKLIFNQIEKDSPDREILAFREVGRILSHWRETSVNAKILNDLKRKYPGIFLELKENEKLAELLMNIEQVLELSEEMNSGLSQINDILFKAGYRLRFQAMNNIDPALLIKELQNSYLRVVNIYRTCRNNPRPDNLHEFRKIAKEFLYQLFFFRPLNPPVVKAIEKKLDVMTSNLGKFNDMTQLVKTLGYKHADNSNLPALDELVIMIREKQDRYLDRVWPIAYKVFCPGQKLINILGFKLLVI
jgi:CHAD domain-containing protein